MSAKLVQARIRLELTQLDQLLTAYEPLIQRVVHQSPDLVELTALASVLHSFYNGLESIFTAIVRYLDQDVPTGDRWHQELLQAMTSATSTRGAVLSAAVANTLVEYLAFRHFFRHSYSLFLDWDKLKPLVLNVERTWSNTRTELEVFLSTIGDSSTASA